MLPDPSGTSSMGLLGSILRNTSWQKPESRVYVVQHQETSPQESTNPFICSPPLWLSLGVSLVTPLCL